MDAVTYPDEKVAQFLSDRLVPLRIPSDAEPLATEFNLKWTPTLIILDKDGKEHVRSVGFLPPDEFIPSIILAMGKAYFDLDKFSEALSHLEKVIRDYAGSAAAPEAVFWRGVAGYKATHNPTPLKEAYLKLQDAYPQSEWTKRALPYRLLP
jgi:tetratricopeptide (TPR) repeat protein